MIGIYKVTNMVNGKSYIGQSKNIEQRFKDHKLICRERNIPLKRALQKYGYENFKYEILEECELSNLDDREMFWINEIKPEYNLDSGGKGSPNHIVTFETRQILKQKGKEFWNNLDNETKNKIITNNLKGPPLGHKVSKETREKLRKCNLGKKQSKETIDKRKNTILEKKRNGYIQTNGNHKKKIICIETNEIFDSLKQAQEKYNLSTLCGHLKGRYKTCKGLHYRYYQENCSVTTMGDECNPVE